MSNEVMKIEVLQKAIDKMNTYLEATKSTSGAYDFFKSIELKTKYELMILDLQEIERMRKKHLGLGV